MNDLKLTYQLEAGAFPYTPQNIRIVRFLKELVIDIINDPAFSERVIEFESDMQEATAKFDPNLLRRAIQNIVVNALVHNPSDTKVKITVNMAQNDRFTISICDNGNGMSETYRNRNGGGRKTEFSRASASRATRLSSAKKWRARSTARSPTALRSWGRA